MSAAQELRTVRYLIACGWTQFVYNRDGAGNQYVSRDKAVCWCAEGAIFASGANEDSSTYKLFYEMIAAEMPAVGVSNAIVRWNDAPSRTQAEVVAAFDRAIALAEARAA